MTLGKPWIRIAALGLVLGTASTASATPPKCKVICCELTCEFDAKCMWGGIVTTCSEFPQWCDDACTFVSDDELAEEVVSARTEAEPAVCETDDATLELPAMMTSAIAAAAVAR